MVLAGYVYVVYEGSEEEAAGGDIGFVEAGLKVFEHGEDGFWRDSFDGLFGCGFEARI